MASEKIAVIGMGYVGIPAAVLLADAGYDVWGIQRRSKRSGWKIDRINEGRCPIGGEEPGLAVLLKKVVDEGRFRATDDYSVLERMDIILIDVQTPTDDDHVPRYRSLKEVSHEVGKRLAPGKLVIIESTVAPGTTQHVVQPILEEESGLKAGLPLGFGLSFSYERVMVGRLLHNIINYPKVVGGIDKESTSRSIGMYERIVKAGVHGTDPKTAEVSKTVENAYRDVQIAFANEVAVLCESLGVDVYDVRRFVNGLPNDPSQPHANPVRNMHYPGAGTGGHCLPKDTWLLLYGSREYGTGRAEYPSSVLASARNLNLWMPKHMTDLLEEALEEAGAGLAGSRICVLGYSFIENSDDPRNTPALPFKIEVERRGGICVVHDPYIEEDEGVRMEPDVKKALQGADAVVLITKHDEYRGLTSEYMGGLVSRKVLVDGRNLFDPLEFSRAGFVFRGVGKGNAVRK